MALVDQYTLAADATFKQRVQQAAIKRALAALGATPDSGIRALANRVLDNPDEWASRLAQCIATDTAIAAKAPTQASVTDAEIQAAVNGLLANFVR